MVLHLIFFLHFWNFEECVSGSTDGTRLTSGTTSLFPDLNPLGFYLWGPSKSTVYAAEASCLQDLQQGL
jgi:hypothetical protein